MNNPYPKTITDEASGIEVTNDKYIIWENGYKVGAEEVARELVKEIMSRLVNVL